jgi:tetratricopeptide (TPR) repeat protein
MDRSARRPFVSYALSFAAISGVCFALYQPALGAPFVLDDWDNLVHNPHVRWTELSFAELREAIVGPRVRRPVAHVSFGLNHYASGYRPAHFRLVNVAIHAFNGLLVCGLTLALLRRWRRIRPASLARFDARADPWLGLAAALLFVAHPVQIQAVTYVVQRMTSLATLFYLGAILLWLRGGSASSAGARAVWRGAAVAAGLLALGSKEIAVALPAALWLIHGLFISDLGRDWLRRSAPWALAAALASLAALAFAAAGPGWALHDFGPWERVLSQPRVLLFYLSLVALPLPSRLNLLHEFEPSRALFDPPATLVAAIAVAVLLAAALLAARRFRFAAFALLWFLLHSALEASPLPLRMAFEHRLYLPLVGFAVALPVGLAALLGARGAAAVAAVAITALAGATFARNQVWSDATRLRVDTAQKSPNDWLAQLLGASALAESGRPDEALALLARVSELEPASPRPHNLRGALLRSQGRLPEALAAFEQAMALDAADPLARAEAARVAAALGDWERAAGLFEASFARSPDERVLVELADVLVRQGELEQALALYDNAAARAPRWPLPYRSAGRVLAHQGRPGPAAERFARALVLAEDEETRAQLANALRALDARAAAHAAAGRFDAAAALARRASGAARASGDEARAAAIDRRAALYAEGRSDVEAPAAGAVR